MSAWPFIKLGSVAEFKNGLNFSSKSWGRGLKVIGVTDFQDYFYPRYDDVDEINPSGVVRKNDYLEEGDVLFVRSNGNPQLIGRSLFISGLPERMSHSGFTIRLRFTSKKVHRLFYVYIFKSSLIRSVLSIYGGGTNISNLNQGILENLDIPLPPLPTQRKIAAILSAYDELMENNRRRIALLEKLAEEIYREWFVRLRFPGHEKVKLVKGVPEGWNILPFSEIVEINPTERIDKDEERPFVAMDELSVSSMYFTHTERRKGHVGPKFRNGDVLFPRITPSVENGKRGLVLTLDEGEVAQGSTEFIVLREKVLSSEHIYFLSVSEGFRTNAELSMTGASGRQRVQEQCFAQFLVKVPPTALRDQFTAIVRPMVSQIHLLSKQTEALRQTRDLLLPRLISGKLSVEELDIQFPPGIQPEPSISTSYGEP
jgi:type I restriction enzyme, S subunit